MRSSGIEPPLGSSSGCTEHDVAQGRRNVPDQEGRRRQAPALCLGPRRPARRRRSSHGIQEVAAGAERRGTALTRIAVALARVGEHRARAADRSCCIRDTLSYVRALYPQMPSRSRMVSSTDSAAAGEEIINLGVHCELLLLPSSLGGAHRVVDQPAAARPNVPRRTRRSPARRCLAEDLPTAQESRGDKVRRQDVVQPVGRQPGLGLELLQVDAGG